MNQQEAPGALTEVDSKTLSPRWYHDRSVVVQGYWWMVGTAVFALLFVLSSAGWIYSEQKRADDVKIAIVKLHPRGDWDVSLLDEHAPRGAFQNTIDMLLKQFAERRYKKDPLTIRNDYAHAAVFLDPTELERFLNEFNASQQASEFINCATCLAVIPEVIGLKHFDATNLDLDALDGSEMITTHVFLRLEHRDPASRQLSHTTRHIVSLAWRVDPSALSASSQEDLQILNVNPIGLKIREYSIQDDAAS